MSFKTADLCDAYADKMQVQIAEPIFRIYGRNLSFSGQITTLKIFEDNTLVRSVLENRVENRVLVIDGGGSHRCALLGDNLAKLAVDNGWNGVVVYGCIRDSADINEMPLGVRALHTHPLKSRKRGVGEQDILVTFAGVNFKTDHYIYVDQDGIIVAPEPLT
ncbi:MAG: ribonuclease E activity regulator RraA [Gammaproteobacteria bacterium]